MQNYFAGLSTATKRIVTISLWALAIGILIVYSFVMAFTFEDKSALGFITMIAILTTDVLVYLIQQAEIIKTATPLSLTLIFNRILLIIFGGEHWVYGYILIYLCYGILLSTIIARHRFPFNDAVSNVDIDNLANEIKVKQS
jgi:hypothetical protein